MKKIVVLLFCLASLSAARAVDFQIIGIKSKFLVVDTSRIRIYMQFDIRKGDAPISTAEFMDRFRLNYVLYADYASRERFALGNVVLDAKTVTAVGNQKMVVFDIERPKSSPLSALMLSEINEAGTSNKALNDLPVRFKNDRMSDRLAVFDGAGRFPKLKNYATIGDTIVLKPAGNEATTAKKVFMYRYKSDFDLAASPMNMNAKNNAQKNLKVDTLVQVAANAPIVFAREGLYFFSEDTTQYFGIGVLVVDKRFPKITRPEKLLRPVSYVSTGQEISELGAGNEAKKTLDRYWLNLMYGNADLAKRTIKSYYYRTEEANRLFTSFKEGWKTDKGMVFMVMGAPDRVSRVKDREVWVFNSKANYAEITFNFVRRPNQFVDDHYELVRYAEYQPIWFAMVETWRTGNVRD